MRYNAITALTIPSHIHLRKYGHKMSTQNIIRSLIIPTNKTKMISIMSIQNVANRKSDIYKIGIHFIPLVNEYKSV